MSMHVYDEQWTRLFSLCIPSCIRSSQPAFQTHTAIVISVEEPRSNLSSPPSLYVGHLLCRRCLAKRNEHGPISMCIGCPVSYARSRIGIMSENREVSQAVESVKCIHPSQKRIEVFPRHCKLKPMSSLRGLLMALIVRLVTFEW